MTNPARKRSDISDAEVCKAYLLRSRLPGALDLFPYDILMYEFQCPFKVAYSAMERAADRGFVDYGVSLRCGGLTEAGKALLAGDGN